MTHRALERGRAPGKRASKIDGSAARPRGSPAAGPPPPRACRIPPGLPVRHECRSVNRNCCLGIWNLYFVFQFPNRRARRVIWNNSAWRYLDLEICPGSKIRGEARNLDSGWPAPVLGNCPVLQNPGRGVESGIWMTRAGSWKLKYSQNAPPSFPAQCLRLPRCF